MIKSKRSFAVGLVAFFVLVVVGVFAAARPGTPSLSPTPTLSPTNSATVEVAQRVVPPTHLPLPTTTALPARNFAIANIEQKVTLASPQSVFTPIPTYSLAIRQPTLTELEHYLLDNKISATSAECALCSTYVAIPALSPQAELIYTDLNGDKEDDLIMSDRIQNTFIGPISFVVVWLWDEHQYSEPLAIVSLSKYSPYQQVLLSDWTGDQIPELIVDQTKDDGGAGFYWVEWIRYIIHCDRVCHVVWSSQTDAIDHFSVAVTFTQAQITPLTNNNGISAFTVRYSSFQSPSHQESNYRQQVKVHRETVEEWIWDGTLFVLASEQTLAEEYEISFQPMLSATNEEGTQAMVTAKPDTVSRANGFAFDMCTLLINEFAVAESFTCDANLTWVSWEDVNGDGDDEVVVIAYTQLVMEQMLIYDWDGVNVRLLAEVTGQVIRPDLYGVRLENIDEDNSLEILAGSYEFAGSNCKMVDRPTVGPVEECWYVELSFYDTVYDWNGTVYVARGRIPNTPIH